jgi:LacI family transcriptional regulator
MCPDTIESPDAASRAIGLLVPASFGFAQQVRRGISDRARQSPDWSLLALDQAAIEDLAARKHRLAGCIVFSATAVEMASVRLTALRIVNTSNKAPPDESLCAVVNDDLAVGRLAAEHFLDRGFRELHFVSEMKTYFARQRWAGIREAAASRGGMAAAWKTTGNIADAWPRLPKPVAVIAENDDAAQDLLRLARERNITVPGEMAVLGIDDNDLAVESATVPLGSVRLAGHEIGWNAADLIVTGQAEPGMRIEHPPKRVVERKSCRSYSVGDERVRKVLELLDAGYGARVDLAKVARKAGLSRRNMDLLFRRMLGVTPANWLEGLRGRAAEGLLADTELPLEEIAARCGYDNTVNLWRVFQRLRGMAPGEYRRKTRIAGRKR